MSKLSGHGDHIKRKEIKKEIPFTIKHMCFVIPVKLLAVGMDRTLVRGNHNKT